MTSPAPRESDLLLARTYYSASKRFSRTHDIDELNKSRSGFFRLMPEASAEAEKALMSGSVDPSSRGWISVGAEWLAIGGQCLRQCQKRCYSACNGFSISPTGELTLDLVEAAMEPLSQGGASSPPLFTQDDVELVLHNGIGESRFSLDPEFCRHQLLACPFQQSSFSPPCLANTPFLETLLLTDFFLKQLLSGLQVNSRAPFRVTPMRQALRAAHLREELIAELLADDTDNCDESSAKIAGCRMWLEVGVTDVSQVGANDYRLGQTNCHVKLQIFEVDPQWSPAATGRREGNGDYLSACGYREMEGNGGSSYERLQSAFTEHWDEIARAFPQFARLKQLGRLCACVAHASAVGVRSYTRELPCTMMLGPRVPSCPSLQSKLRDGRRCAADLEECSVTGRASNASVDTLLGKSIDCLCERLYWWTATVKDLYTLANGTTWLYVSIDQRKGRPSMWVPLDPARVRTLHTHTAPRQRASAQRGLRGDRESIVGLHIFDRSNRRRGVITAVSPTNIEEVTVEVAQRGGDESLRYTTSLSELRAVRLPRRLCDATAEEIASRAVARWSAVALEDAHFQRWRAVVKDVDSSGDRYLVGYVGFAREFDEWVRRDSPRITALSPQRTYPEFTGRVGDKAWLFHEGDIHTAIIQRISVDCAHPAAGASRAVAVDLKSEYPPAHHWTVNIAANPCALGNYAVQETPCCDTLPAAVGGVKIVHGNKRVVQLLSPDKMSEVMTQVANGTFTKSNEGTKLTADKKHHISYICTEGYLTGGYGHRFQGDDILKYPEGTIIPDNVVQDWYDRDMGRAEKYANDLATKYGGLYGNPKVKAVLIDLAFQVGSAGADKFAKLHKALQDGNLAQAAKELVDSKLTEQTYNRNQKRANLLLHK